MSALAAKHPSCSDPFKVHKSRIKKGLRNASKDLVTRVQDVRITSDTLLCVKCRLRLSKDPKSLPDLESDTELIVQEASASSSSSLGANCSSVASPNVGESAKDLEEENVKIVMHCLDQTPVRRSEFSFFTIYIELILAIDIGHVLMTVFTFICLCFLWKIKCNANDSPNTFS